jgi:hypothetical protein
MSYIGQAQSSNVFRTVTNRTATAGQTVFPVYGGYALGFVDVFMNGILLVEAADFTANDGANVTLLSGAAAGDELMIVAYTPTTQIANRAEVRQSFTATAGQTTFTVTGGYTPGMLSVYLNGVKMVNGADVTASNGTTVVFPVGLVAGDVVDVVGLVSFAVADAVRKTGDVMTGDLDVMTNVGVGTTTPNKGGVGRAVTLNTASGGNIVEFCLAESRVGWVYGDNNLTALAAGGNRRVSLQTNGEERLIVDGSGRVAIPNQPCFQVSFSTANTQSISAGNKVPFNAIDLENGSNFSTANNRYTAPVTGKYKFTAQFFINSTSGPARPCYRVNGTDYFLTTDAVQGIMNITGSECSLILDCIIPLTAGDYIEVFARAGTTTLQYYQGHTWWSGYLIG